ncbi:MAG: hypothetical protein RL264_1858 [Bacteroidota bacterium]|jgi:hypothetical protein
MSKNAKPILLDVESESYLIWGLSIGFADYRVAYLLNNQLEISLRASDSQLPKFNKKTGAFQYFNYFEDIREDDFTAHFLIKNSQNNQLLVSNQHLMDYFYVLKPNYKTDSQEVLRKLRSINEIVAAYPAHGDILEFAQLINI